MDSEWALVEYRRGRYAKVTPDGTVLGKATDDEIKAWFASHGWRFGRPRMPEPAQIPDSPEELLAEEKPATGARGEESGSIPSGEPGHGSAEQPTLPAFDRDGAHTATTEHGREPATESVRRDGETASEELKAMPPAPQRLATEPEPRPEAPAPDLAAAPQVQVDKQASAHRPARIDALPASAQKSTEQKALEREPATQAPDAVLRESATRRARDSSAGGEETFGEDEEASIPAAESAIDEKTAGGASAMVVKPAIVPLSSPEQVAVPAEPAFHEADSTDRWLWVDPRQEQGYSPAGFDVAAFLDRAIDLFRSKPWTSKKDPRRLAVHPSAVAEPLETAAEARDLEIVADPKVAAGTYMLALAEREKVEN